MSKDFDVDHPERSPSFFFHLGDVVYHHHKDQSYRPQFYEPYEHYPGRIIAIPGNHDHCGASPTLQRGRPLGQ
jgi:calcineurin-like phosphoesterase family protein